MYATGTILKEISAWKKKSILRGCEWTDGFILRGHLTVQFIYFGENIDHVRP
jgi:hypothetical protein